MIVGIEMIKYLRLFTSKESEVWWEILIKQFLETYVGFGFVESSDVIHYKLQISVMVEAFWAYYYLIIVSLVIYIFSKDN